MDALGEQLFAGAAFADNQHGVSVPGRHQGLLLELFDGPAAADDAVQGVARGAQGHQFFFVALDLGLEVAQFFGQFDHVPHVLKHDQSENRDHLTDLFDGDAVHHDILPAYHLHLVDLGNTRSRNNVHPSVFNHLGAMFADALLDITSQKTGIRLVEMGYDTIGIGHHGTIVNAVEYQVKKLQLVLYRLHFFIIDL